MWLSRCKDRRRVLNFLASGTVVGATVAFYLHVPYFSKSLATVLTIAGHTFDGPRVLVSAAMLYTALLALFYFSQQVVGVSKSVTFVRVVCRFARAPVTEWRAGLAPAERLAVMATMLKAYFAPMMLMFLFGHLARLVGSGATLASEPLAAYSSFRTLLDSNLFWFVFSVILFVDLVCFTLGYLVELPRLKNEIRSVDSTLIGCGAALLCYGPFNQITASVLGWYVDEFPKFEETTTHVALNAVLLVLMAIYSWASVALGFKASNLTHRGIVCRGPYAVVRHPAYVCKNIAWWIGSLPAISFAFGMSFWAGISAVASIVGWSMIYVLRALTEEDHLRSVDGDFAAYAARVRYRFVPGLW